VLNVSVPEPRLQRPRVVAGIGQRVAAAVPQHVRVDWEPNSAWNALPALILAQVKLLHGHSLSSFAIRRFDRAEIFAFAADDDDAASRDIRLCCG
jgi:hypothetical protein